MASGRIVRACMVVAASMALLAIPAQGQSPPPSAPAVAPGVAAKPSLRMTPVTLPAELLRAPLNGVTAGGAGRVIPPCATLRAWAHAYSAGWP